MVKKGERVRKDEPMKFTVAVTFISTKFGSSASVLRKLAIFRLDEPPPLPLPLSSWVAVERGGKVLLGDEIAGFVIDAAGA